jgi:hypothetical protein
LQTQRETHTDTHARAHTHTHTTAEWASDKAGEAQLRVDTRLLWSRVHELDYGPARTLRQFPAPLC